MEYPISGQIMKSKGFEAAIGFAGTVLVVTEILLIIQIATNTAKVDRKGNLLHDIVIAFMARHKSMVYHEG
jgi:hypothetical protein